MRFIFIFCKAEAAGSPRRQSRQAEPARVTRNNCSCVNRLVPRECATHYSARFGLVTNVNRRPRSAVKVSSTFSKVPG